MFNFRRKQPEKPKPNFIGEQHEHKACIIIFDNTSASVMIDRIRPEYQKCTVIKNKYVERLSSMLESCNELSDHYYRYHSACIQTLNIASSVSEATAIQLGLVKPNSIQGIAICPGCLQQAVLACEEVLQSLKDIQEATKEYV